jgi:AraC-like DNA-binding protein
MRTSGQAITVTVGGTPQMTSRTLDSALVPASYAARFIALVETHGVTAEQLLVGTGWTRGQLDEASARMSVAALTQVFANAMRLTNDPSLGLEFGLSLKASSHGQLGIALMTCRSLRDAIQLSERYMEVRAMPWRVQLVVEGDRAIMRFIEIARAEQMRWMLLETVLGAVIRLGEFMLGVPFAHPEIEFRYDAPSLPHHARFTDQVPRVVYDVPENQAIFPASWLDRPLALCEPVTNREAISALENERRILHVSEDLLERARAVLADPQHGFPGLEQVARQLSVSSRTLRRHLRERGKTFQELRDAARRARAIVLLEESKLAIDDVARALGYADTTGFIRAFQRWTGEAPSAFRKRTRAHAR